MTEDAFLKSVAEDTEPPAELSAELKSLWLAQNDHWHEAHNIAQDIDTPMGSWIHGHLHLIEGDLGNAGYWYRLAGKPVATPEERESDWQTIVTAALEAQ